MKLSSLLIEVNFFLKKVGIAEAPAVDRIYLSSYFAYKALFEDSFLTLIKHVPGAVGDGVAIDVGANVGYISKMILERTRAKKVISFEPDPLNLRRFKKALGDNSRVTLHPWAVSSKSGTLVLALSPSSPSDNRIATSDFVSQNPFKDFKSFEVPAVSLDDYAAKELAGEKITFIKIDVQGYEQSVLEGMTATIKSNPKLNILLEYSPEHARQLGFDADQPYHFLKSFSYRFYCLARGPHFLKEMDLELLKSLVPSSYAYFDILCTREEIRK